ncbi:MAG TPA: hypothetical protein VF188_10795 [Longimicrobiales bacterium]
MNWNPARGGSRGLLVAFALAAAAGCADGITDADRPLLFSAVSAGGDHTCGIGTDGGAFCWGRGAYGELGTGGTEDSPVPVRVGGGVHFTAISAGGSHTCGLAEDGSAYCWGWNVAGQLGTGNTVGYGLPTIVTGGLHFEAITSGENHTCAIAADGTAYCWGDNGSGQLGNGTTLGAVQPVAVAGGLRFISLSAGAAHTCGVSVDGVAYCWGLNHLGQLGTGGTEDAWEPTRVAGDLDFVMISAGFAHTCAIAVDGAAYCWGSNTAGELGNTFIEPPRHAGTLEPGRVHGGAGLVWISAGPHYTCGVGADGVGFCWGRGIYGQIGNGLTLNFATPQRISERPERISAGALRFRSVSTGGTHTCGRATTDAVYCWGTGELGQLGNPGFNYSPVPILVTRLR